MAEVPEFMQGGFGQVRGPEVVAQQMLGEVRAQLETLAGALGKQDAGGRAGAMPEVVTRTRAALAERGYALEVKAWRVFGTCEARWRDQSGELVGAVVAASTEAACDGAMERAR